MDFYLPLLMRRTPSASADIFPLDVRVHKKSFFRQQELGGYCHEKAFFKGLLLLKKS